MKLEKRLVTGRCILSRYFVLILTLLITVSTTAISANSQDQIGSSATELSQDTSSRHETPFLLLLSEDELAMAQMPLIENGTIRVIYKIQDTISSTISFDDGDRSELGAESNSPRDLDSPGDLEDSDEQDERDSDDVDDLQKTSPTLGLSHADAREYEQMPANTSLGKSEWLKQEQIAASKQWASSGDQGSREEIGTTKNGTTASADGPDPKEDEADSEHAGGPTSRDRPRRHKPMPRRMVRSTSNSLANDYGNAATARPSNCSNNGAGTVMESSSSAAVQATSNVTSARSGSINAGSLRSTRARRSKEEGQSNSGRMLTSSPEEGRHRNRIQFSDFDVHMALGYAFLADSWGNIHRFKLDSLLDGSGKRDDNDGENLSGYDIKRANSDAGSKSDDDYSNTIDAAGSSENSLSAHRSQPRKLTTMITGRTVESNDGGISSDADGSSTGGSNNKVRDSNVNHEQFGQHPTSGVGKLVSKSGSQAVTASSIIKADPDDAPPYHGADSTDSISPKPAHHTDRSSASTRANEIAQGHSKVIWSRIKHGNRPRAHRKLGGARIDAQKQGALPSGAGRLNGPSSEVKTNQMVNGTEATGGIQEDFGLHSNDGRRSNNAQAYQNGRVESDKVEKPRTGDESFPAPTQSHSLRSKQTMPTSPKLPTEIAVDWLNNLLFVLDKYRLLVVDFEGNNELVLIDDFNINNRPADIKLDPVNNFLFWLQVGKFHNTIYKLNLESLSVEKATERLLSNKLNSQLTAGQRDCKIIKSSTDSPPCELVALISHHYAHPIITNLPKHVRLFSIDHKHSKIYVPLSPVPGTQTTDTPPDQSNKTIADEAEVFAPPNDATLTHLNSSSTLDEQLANPIDCNTTTNSEVVSQNKILTYNLDGTDAGPVRGASNEEDYSGMNEMLDLTIDSNEGFLYWLSNGGREIVEEYREQGDPKVVIAQHKLDKKYAKLLYFSHSNQPRDDGNRTRTNSRINLTHLMRDLSFASKSQDYTNRSIRSEFLDDNQPASSLNRIRSSHLSSDASKLSRNAPYVILGVVSLLVLIVYLIYAFVSQRFSIRSERGGGRPESIGGSSMGDSHPDCESRLSGFMSRNSISRWMNMNKPSTSTQRTDNSTTNRDLSIVNNDCLDSCDLDSATNYPTSNAIDEHYKESMNDRAARLFNDLDTDRLANLGQWPTNSLDMSNKLYVPVEVLQDETLASINRISIDQLEIERRNPLGEGHFGTVLQGTIKCHIDERDLMLINSPDTTACIKNHMSLAASLRVAQRRRVPVSSSTSSGHGSSSVSSDFITATNGLEASNGDYLTPKSQCTSNMSDYLLDNHIPESDESCYQNQAIGLSSNQDTKIDIPSVFVETKFRVAIKKLKDNASPKEKKDFLQEAKLLANFDHLNIVQLIGICLDRGSTLIVMELMLGGDLIRYMQENTPQFNEPSEITDDDLMSICLDIVNGCCYLEEKKYIHRDLAARNCLVSSRKREERVVKLADFGLARDIYKDYYKKLNDSAMPLKWMAPECLIEQKSTIKSEVWSFGVVMWEVMSYCQEKPYGNIEPCLMREYLTSGSRLQKPDGCREEIYDLMRACWQLEPVDRPTFEECRIALIEIRNNYSRRL